ncbi:MAG: hypothetical protein H7Y41_04915 [Hyphomonadaceae bacterium]|nr:hypothetical protein [Clostridia bacterium]
MKVIGVLDDSQQAIAASTVDKMLRLGGLRCIALDGYEIHQHVKWWGSMPKLIAAMGEFPIDILLLHFTAQSITPEMLSSMDLLYISDTTQTVEIAGFSKTLVVDAENKAIFQAIIGMSIPVITIGFGSKVTVTASSIDEEEKGTTLSYCLQRGINTFFGEELEPLEFPISLLDDNRLILSLGAVTVALLAGVLARDIQKMLL